MNVCIIGVGGAGSRIAGKAAPRVLGAAHVAAVNTDARELDGTPVPVKLQIGATRTGGLGAGGAAASGRLAMEDDLPTLREFVAGKDLVVVVAGLGGGTGSGAAPAILRAAADAEALTLAVVTLPFDFEGPRRQAVAQDALRAVREATDAMVVMANDRLAEAVGEAGLKAAFERADDLLGSSVSMLCNLLAQPGYIKLDFADLRQLLRHGGGTCSLAYAATTGAGRAAEAANVLLEGTLFEGGQVVKRAKAVLVGITGGADLAVREVGEVMQAIQGAVSADCHVSMGTHVSDEFADGLQVVVLAAEQWTDAVPEPVREDARVDRKVAPRRGGRTRQKEAQITLGLHVVGRGRFRNVEPTILDGEDLDIPTYIRRGIVIET